MTTLELASGFPAATEEEWRERVAAALKGADFSRLTTRSADGIEIAPLYGRATESHTAPLPAKQHMPWQIVQRMDMPDLPAANAQALEDLRNGASGLALVLPGAVTAGPHGLAAQSLDDFKRLLADVELDLISLRLDAGKRGRSAFVPLVALYKSRNLDLAKADLCLGLDPLAALALTGAVPAAETLQSRMAEIFRQLQDEGFGGSTFSADTRCYHGAGASEAQEVAAAAATAVQFLRWLESESLPPDQTAPGISFIVSADADQFLTIAKLRALRVVWQRVQAAIGLEPKPARIHVESAMRMMSRHDAHVNLLRTAMACFASGAGGADAVTLLPFTGALGLADGFARRMARNIQLILQEESRIGQVGDPAAGSGYVESLTGEIAQTAWKAFQEIEKQGGMLASLEAGHFRKSIAATHDSRMAAVAGRKHGLTGVSEFPDLAETPADMLDMPLPAQWTEIETDPAPQVTCTPLQQHRLAEPFETLRDAAQVHTEKNGTPPTVFLANLGSAADFTPRASWIRNALAAGGIHTAGTDGFSEPKAAADAFAASGARLACLCGTDSAYETSGADMLKALKAAGAKAIFVAGKPKVCADDLEAAGATGFLAAGMNLPERLAELHALLDVKPL